MILPKKFVFQNIKNQVVFKNLDDSGVLSSDFPGPRTSAASLTSLASATSMASTALKALFHKKILILMVGSSLAPPKWPILAPFCGMDHQKSKFSLKSDTLSVGGCWGQLMLFFFEKWLCYQTVLYISIPEPSSNHI